MVVAVGNTIQSSYCCRCKHRFDRLQTQRNAKSNVPLSCVCQDKMDTVLDEGSVGGPSWTSETRPDVKLTCRVHFVTCHTCKARHRNPPSDYLYTEEKTNDVAKYGALLRLMGDVFEHRYSPDHR